MRNPHPDERITRIEGGPLALELSPNGKAWSTPIPTFMRHCWFCKHPVDPTEHGCKHCRCEKWHTVEGMTTRAAETNEEEESNGENE